MIVCAKALKAKLEEYGIAEKMDSLVDFGWRSLEEIAEMDEADMIEAGFKGSFLKKLEALKESLSSSPFIAGKCCTVKSS